MATINKADMTPANKLGSTPWGNLAVLRYTFETTSTGVAKESDTTTAVAVGDVVRLGLIPSGFRVVDSEVIVSDAFTTGVTARVGFAYADGEDVAAVPQDDDHFGTTLALGSAARLRSATTHATACLPKAAWLTLTIGGAAIAEAGKAEVILFAVAEGAA